MKTISRIRLLPLALCPVIFSSCVDPSTGLSTSLSSGGTPATPATPAPVEESLTKHDVALRFLTAYIRLDQSMALRYATPEAVGKLDWKSSHRGNIPYYNDKMLLQFSGGWARVFFQDMGGTYRITDLEVHRN